MSIHSQHEIKGYVLGHSPQELERLERQGSFMRNQTRDLLIRAGLQPGMRVLDFGSGVGDVAFLAAELVGPHGEVIGVDRSAESLEIAATRALTKQLSQVQFIQLTDGLQELVEEQPFDAVIGRLVFIHQPNPRATFAEVARLLRPGGVVAFLEIDIDGGFWTTQPLPLQEQLWHWVTELRKRGVFPHNLGVQFHLAFEDQGMVDCQVIRVGRIEHRGGMPLHAWMAGFFRSITPLLQRFGLIDPADVAAQDTLAQRLYAEAHQADAFFITVCQLCAFAKKPAAAT